MSGSVNKVFLIGHLGRDAELRTAGSGVVSNFSLACTEVWTDKSGQKQERVEWIRCSLWGKQADALNEYLTKGKQIAVEGKIASHQYEKDGVKVTAWEIRVDRVTLLGGGRDRGEGHERSAYPVDDPATAPITDDDIPFAWLIGFIVPASLLLHHATTLLI